MTFKLTKWYMALMACFLTPIVWAQKQVGKATYYAKRTTGWKTASGDVLHHDSLTCAHRTYPFGSLLKVINVKNGKEVIVKVTDRGPFGKGKIIDLTWKAAETIGILSQGVASVIVEPVFLAKVPYRMSERIELPEMDFDVSSAGYSFMTDWKKEAKKKTKTVGEIKQNKEKAPRKGGDKTTDKTIKNANNNEQQTNKWSDVFKKMGF